MNKLLVVGDIGCGKSSYVRRLRGLSYDGGMRHMGIGNCNYKIIYDTGSVIVRDVGDGTNEGMYIGGTHVIIMYDVCERYTLAQLSEYVGRYLTMCGDIPIVVVGSKCDVVDTVEIDNIMGYPHVYISSRDGTNMDTPLEYLFS